MLRFLAILSAICAFVFPASRPGFALEPSTSPVRLGMPTAMFREVKPAMFAALSRPLYSLVESQTGLKSELVLVPSPDDMRQQLADGKIQFGVFHGFEFAWMKLKDPQLKALMIAAPLYRPLKAYVVVAASSTAKTICDLKGQKVALPHGTREHARVFIDRQCQCHGDPPSKFFGEISNPNSPETALHELFDNKVQAAIVDGAALQCFAERYPARAKRIHTLAESPPFPLSVVAIHQGAIDAATVRKFQDGMVRANTNVTGRQMMGLIQMTGFEPVPQDYEHQLAEIAKQFPPPAESPK